MLEPAAAEAIESWVRAGGTLLAVAAAREGLGSRLYDNSAWRARNLADAPPGGEIAVPSLRGAAPAHWVLKVGTEPDQRWLTGDWNGREPAREWPEVPGATMRWSGGRSGVLLPVQAGADHIVRLSLSAPPLALGQRGIGVRVNGQSVAVIRQPGKQESRVPLTCEPGRVATVARLGFGRSVAAFAAGTGQPRLAPAWVLAAASGGSTRRDDRAAGSGRAHAGRGPEAARGRNPKPWPRPYGLSQGARRGRSRRGSCVAPRRARSTASSTAGLRRLRRTASCGSSRLSRGSGNPRGDGNAMHAIRTELGKGVRNRSTQERFPTPFSPFSTRAAQALCARSFLRRDSFGCHPTLLCEANCGAHAKRNRWTSSMWTSRSGRGCNSGCGSLLDLLAGAHPKADFGDPDKGHRRDRFSAAIELPMIAVVVLVSQNMQDVHSALPKLFRRTSIASRPRRSAELGAGIWLSTLKQPRRFPAKISTGDRIGRSGSRAPRHSRVIRTRFGCGTVRQKRVGRSLTWKETPAP